LGLQRYNLSYLNQMLFLFFLIFKG